MNIDIQAQKAVIIEQLNQINNKNLIKAIKDMLDTALKEEKEYDTPKEHEDVIQEHIEEYKNNPSGLTIVKDNQKDLELELKNDLHRLIVESNDIVILKQIHEHFKNLNIENSDWWLKLSSEQKKTIQKSIDQLDNGKGISHEKVRENINKLFSQYE